MMVTVEANAAGRGPRVTFNYRWDVTKDVPVNWRAEPVPNGDGMVQMVREGGPGAPDLVHHVGIIIAEDDRLGLIERQLRRSAGARARETGP